jgi:hypothetical protein
MHSFFIQLILAALRSRSIVICLALNDLSVFPYYGIGWRMVSIAYIAICWRNKKGLRFAQSFWFWFFLFFGFLIF